MTLPIFLVEDDPHIRDQLVELTRISLGADIVGLAETELDALLWLHSHQGAWKVAVVDLFLKDGTGFGILSNLDGCRSGKVVILTNSATTENKIQCLYLGADAFFDKTSELENFLDYCSSVGNPLGPQTE